MDLHKFALEQVGFGSEIGPEDILNDEGEVYGYRVSANLTAASTYRDFEFENEIKEEVLMLVRAGIELPPIEWDGECSALAAPWKQVLEIICEEAAKKMGVSVSDTPTYSELKSMDSNEFETLLGHLVAIIKS